MSPVPLHAITVAGHDGPGIIAQTTGILADLGLNLEDCTTTLLRGHFALILVCQGEVSQTTIEDALAGMGADHAFTVRVSDMPREPVSIEGTSWVVTVHGGDRPGIVSSVVAELAAVGGNITDLFTRLAGDLYLLVVEVVRETLVGLGDRLGVGVSLHEVASDDAGPRYL